MKFPGILVLGLQIKILKGEHNFVELEESSFVLSGILRGKSNTLKSPGEF